MSAYLDSEALALLGDTSLPSGPPSPDGLRVPSGEARDMAIAGDAYEGASHFSREMAMRNPPTRSADNDLLPQKRTADARVRDSSRNDAYVRGGTTLHKDNIVGGMFMLNSKPLSKVLLGKEDETFETELQEELEVKFTLVAESPDNWLDAQRINTFTGMVRLIVGIYSVAGEILASAEWLRDWNAVRPFNTAIQILDLDRLSTPPLLMNDRNVRGGVERNQYGAPLAYHVRMAHPTDSWNTPDAWTWKRVPIRKPWGRLQMIHIFEQERPDQTRGVSEMVTALKEMRQTKDFREIVLQNAVVNATYAASIESELDTNAIFARLGGGNLGEEGFQNAVEGAMAGYLGAVSQYIGDNKQFQIGGVRIPHLPPGSKLQLRPAGQGGPLGTEFEQSLLRYIASSLGVSYEQLSRDYTQTNYSSARAAMTETWKFMQARKKMVADRFASIVFRLWLEEALNKRAIESLPNKLKGASMDWLYQGQNFDAIANCDWIGASRGQIDELKETQAAVLRIKYGLSTREDELARLGKDYRQTFRQTKRENDLADKLGLVFNDAEDNSINAASGSPQEREARGEKDDGSEENAE